MFTQILDLTAVDKAITLDQTGLQIGSGVAALQYVSGTGTVVVEGTVDGVNWVAILLTNKTTGTTAASATAAGIYTADFDGLEQVRVRKSVGGTTCVVAFTLKIFP